MSHTFDPNDPNQMYMLHDEAKLRISDIERLAKAGVTMTFKDIARQVVPDPLRPPDEGYMQVYDPGSKALMDRWYMNPENSQRRVMRDGTHPEFHVSTARHGETVYVFIAARGRAPVVLEDDVHIFPSDALLAKIHLLRQTQTP